MCTVPPLDCSPQQDSGWRCILFVPEDSHPSSLRGLQHTPAAVIRTIPRGHEGVTRITLEDGKLHVLAAKPGGQSWSINLMAQIKDDDMCPFRLTVTYYRTAPEAPPTIWEYELWMHEEAFNYRMLVHGTFPQELSVVRFLHTFVRRGRGLQDGKPPSVSFEELLTWMTQWEPQVRQKSTYLPDAPYFRLGNSDWALDISQQLLVPLDRMLQTYGGGSTLHSQGGVVWGFDVDQLPRVLQHLFTLVPFSLHEMPQQPQAPQEPPLPQTAPPSQPPVPIRLYPSRATLVADSVDCINALHAKICHLPWRIVKLTNMHELDTAGHYTLEHVDLVLVSYELLFSPKYSDKVEYFVRYMLKDYVTSLPYILSTFSIQAATRAALYRGLLSQDFVPLQSIQWHRVIYLNSETMWNMFASLQCLGSPYRIPLSSPVIWTLNHRPLREPVKTEQLQRVFGLWQQPISSWTATTLDHIVFYYTRQVTNTRELHTPTHLHHWIIQPESERRVLSYMATKFNLNQTRMVQLCCYYQLLDHLPHHQINLMPTASVIATLRMEQMQELDSTKQCRRHAQQRLKLPLSSINRERQGRDKRIQSQIQSYSSRIVKQQQTLQYLDQISTELKEQTGPTKCPVCMESDVDSMSTCGHQYCILCLLVQVQINHKCALCSHPLVFSDCYQFEDSPSATFGTKLQHLVDLVKPWYDQKQTVVICAEYLELLRLVKLVLNIKGMPLVEGLWGLPDKRFQILDQFATGAIQILLVPIPPLDSAPCTLWQGSHQLVMLHALVNSEQRQWFQTQMDAPRSNQLKGIHWLVTTHPAEASCHQVMFPEVKSPDNNPPPYVVHPVRATSSDDGRAIIVDDTMEEEDEDEDDDDEEEDFGSVIDDEDAIELILDMPGDNSQEDISDEAEDGSEE